MSWILILDFTSSLRTQIAGVKLIFSGNLGNSTKEAMMLLLSRNNMYIAFSKCKVSCSIFFFILPLITQIAYVTIGFFRIFHVFLERSSDINSFVEHLIYNIFKVKSVLNLDSCFPRKEQSYCFFCDLPLFSQRAYLKAIFSWNFRCSSKEADRPCMKHFQNA